MSAALCQQLHLSSLASQLPEVLEAARQQQLSYEAFLEQALQTELEGRRERAQARRIRAARLPFPARLERFDYRFQPGVSERLMRELASLAFLETATNVVFLGPPGVGKTHLACGLAHAALDAGHSVMFATLREVVGQLTASAGRRTTAALRRYRQSTVLVIDEIGYTRLTQEQAHGLFDLITDRYERCSTLLTSNLTFSEWGHLLGDDVLATALLDRLLHHAEVITINGQSYRMRQRMQADQKTVSADS